MKQIIWTVKEELERNPMLFNWMILSQIVGTLMCMFYFYYQNQLPDLSSYATWKSLEYRCSLSSE